MADSGRCSRQPISDLPVMQMQRLLAFIALVLCTPLSAEEPAPPFHIGPWELGMNREQVSSFQSFGPYRVSGKPAT